MRSECVPWVYFSYVASIPWWLIALHILMTDRSHVKRWVSLEKCPELSFIRKITIFYDGVEFFFTGHFHLN